MQAKDIPDDLFIQAVAECSLDQNQDSIRPEFGSWCNRFEVGDWLTEHMGVDVPQKIVLAKAKALVKKGRLDACTCGCRGDFDLRGFPDDPFTTP